jgi:hypothetical protein
MTSSSWLSPVGAGSTANLRAWGSGIRTALQAAGLVLSSTFTSQINWSTIVAPGIPNNQTLGHEIYLLSDELQGSFPIVIKITYGAVNDLLNGSMLFTVGTGHNAAGVMSGVILTTPAYTLPGTAVGSTGHFAAGDGSWFWFYLCPLVPVSRATILFGLERSKDANGIDTGDGVAFFVSGSDSTDAGDTELFTVKRSTGAGARSSYAGSVNAGPWAMRSSFGASLPGVTTNNTIVSPDMLNPVYLKTFGACSGVQPWTCRTFLIPASGGEAALAGTFTGNPDGHQDCTYRAWATPFNVFGLPLNRADNIVGYSYSPALRWA